MALPFTPCKNPSLTRKVGTAERHQAPRKVGHAQTSRVWLAAGACVLLAGCDMASWPTANAPRSSLTPEVRTPQPAPPPAPTAPSQASQQLAAYYARIEADLLVRGLLRTDGGGIDTPYSRLDLVRNFERIAFFDEYARGGGLRQSDGRAGQLKRWGQPVRVGVTFGASVPDRARARDRSEVQRYTQRLARVTGHPISFGAPGTNFHVFIASEDDRASLPAQVRQIVPNINPAALDLFANLPRSIHCFVIAFAGGPNPFEYTQAIALIRSEHPTLLRRSCIHEEIAQGLGLANDSPRARPSIFNDDDEFALLTTHDEELLALLYDPRLRAGMTLSEARPIYSGIATRPTGGQAL
ncbi:DUF2927 domain-containing protein [Pseudaestuariivita sp.]|uniref:DUF2927 domain-containing protein n=1 Tax=Pseudaestuariivita sp. TaxID=2211669 RepID=UPI004058FF0C